MNHPPIETERKYLIRYPDITVLKALPGVRILHMRQTYLLAEDGIAARVRRVEESGSVRFIRTEKRRINAISAFEEETELTEKQYRAALAEADPTRHPIEKTRYVVPHGTLFCEIDVYPFWDDRAILEIELPDENTLPALPVYLTILTEVSEDRRYSNRALAKEIPQDALPSYTD